MKAAAIRSAAPGVVDAGAKLHGRFSDSIGRIDLMVPAGEVLPSVERLDLARGSSALSRARRAQCRRIRHFGHPLQQHVGSFAASACTFQPIAA